LLIANELLDVKENPPPGTPPPADRQIHYLGRPLFSWNGTVYILRDNQTNKNKTGGNYFLKKGKWAKRVGRNEGNKRNEFFFFFSQIAKK
jgi:hypothetical protein